MDGTRAAPRASRRLAEFGKLRTGRVPGGSSIGHERFPAFPVLEIADADLDPYAGISTLSPRQPRRQSRRGPGAASHRSPGAAENEGGQAAEAETRSGDRRLYCEFPRVILPRPIQTPLRFVW